MWRFGNLWAGNEASYEALISVSAQVSAMIGSGQQAPLPELLHIDSGVGIVSIEGALIPGDAGFYSYFGYVGYNDIRTAAMAAVMNPDVKSIMLHINSGGGAVDGCQDCADMLAQVAGLKPTMVFADNSLGSGAYWLATSAGKIFISTTTEAGSVGVIAKAAEYSKARAAAGITDLVVRSGPYKQLINGVEAHTDAAVAMLQERVNAIADVFLEHVADARGVSAKQFDATMGQGRVFTGAKAVQVGIVDGLATYDSALSAAILIQPR
jgi:capsid assembly protease